MAIDIPVPETPETIEERRKIYRLLDALEDCHPKAVQDWVWERAQEMGLVNPGARP